MMHIYECELLNNENQPNLKYENIFNGQLIEQIEISRRFTHNMKIREEIKSDNLIVVAKWSVLSRGIEESA